MNEDTRKKRAEYMRQWRSAHPEYADKAKALYAQRATSIDFKITNRERVRIWRQANPERAKEAKRASYHKNKVLLGRPTKELHHNWKGDTVGYHSLHRWIDCQKGKPSKCEHCGTTSAKRFEWANVDHKYSRVLDDYIRLCTSCHRMHDYKNGLSKPGGRRKQS